MAIKIKTDTAPDERKKSTAARKDVRREADKETESVPSGITIPAAGTQALPVDIPNALSRADVVGRHLLKKAKEWGWEDDGKGAFEYVQRISYDAGKKSMAPSESETSRSVSANESTPVDTTSRTFRTRKPNGTFDRKEYNKIYQRAYRKHQRELAKAKGNE